MLSRYGQRDEASRDGGNVARPTRGEVWLMNTSYADVAEVRLPTTFSLIITPLSPI